MYVKKETLEVVAMYELFGLHVNVSFPYEGPDDEWLNDNGYATLADNRPPEIPNKVIEYKGVVEVNGEYHKRYEYRSMTPEELASATAASIKAYENAVQEHIEAKARELGYDSVYTACTYADEPAVPKFQNEGRALRAWRSNVWATAHTLMNEVLAVNMEQPTIEELLSLLPPFTME